MNTPSRKALALTLAAATGLTLAACSSDSDSAAGGDSKHITIGTTDASKKQWDVFQDQAQEKGIDLEVVNYNDYTTPNTALAEGQIDVNLFQHLKFLAGYNVANGKHLVPVGSTEIVPLALYWKDHSNLDGIEGQTVAIPSDGSNQGRAINVLVQAGLITLKQGDLVSPSPADIDEDASKVKVLPMEATQTTVAYGEGKPAIINNTFLNRANIDPTSAVFADNPESKEAEPYINAFVTTEENKDNQTIKELVDIWQSPEVTAAVAEESNGTSVPVKRPAADLQQILDRLEKDQKDNQ